MAKATAAQMVGTFTRMLAEKWGYVYGAQGETWTDALAEKWSAQARKGLRPVPSGRNRDTYFTQDCARWEGRRVADCSGGIVYAIQQYNADFSDRNANSFYSIAQEKGKIDTLPETPGLGLWRKGHIGLYVGGGYAIEFRGTAYGCVKTRVDARGWTHWMQLAGVEYGDVPDTMIRAPDVYYAVCAGNSVNIRAGRGIGTRILAVARKGDKMLADRAVDGWCAVAARAKDGQMVTGYMSEKYVDGVVV